MGSWPFIAALVGLMMLWAVLNTVVFDDRSWDPYPYILLNLGLSMLAGLQGAILLIAAKRQDVISASMARHHFETDVAAKWEIEDLREYRVSGRAAHVLAMGADVGVVSDQLVPGRWMSQGYP